MSIGCGTLASPTDDFKHGIKTGNFAASSSNGKQHTLPRSPMHGSTDIDDINNHWDSRQPKGPTRLWGATRNTKYGGEERIDGTSEMWLSGEYWNVDSNIRKWGEHEMRRNAAAANHDVHRHDQIKRIVLVPQKSEKLQIPRVVTSGAITADSSFLEPFGFDLGLRDRQANLAGRWNPVTYGEQFRSLRSYDRNIPRMLETYRSLRRTSSVPGSPNSTQLLTSQTLRPEDVGGEAGELSNEYDRKNKSNWEQAGRTHGSRSCHYWDRYDHVPKREGAKMSHGVHSHALRSHSEHPMSDVCEVRPAAIYTKKFQTGSEELLRRHESKGVHPSRHQSKAEKVAGQSTRRF